MSLRPVNDHRSPTSSRAVIENLVKENMIDDIISNKNTIVVLLGQLIYATNLDGSNKRIAEDEKHQNSRMRNDI